jgi:transposase-like protein
MSIPNLAESNQQTCIFCLENSVVDIENNKENSKKILQNNLCPCKYSYHEECKVKFIVDSKYSCPLCRKIFNIQLTNNSELPSSIYKTVINILLCLIIVIIVGIMIGQKFTV